MNPILEKISKGETRLHDIEAILAGLEKDAKADDGQITEEDVEWARIQSLRKKIGQVRNSIANLQEEYDTNVKNWNDKEADYKALKAKIEELVTWGDPDAASFRTDVSNIDAAVDDDLYKKATEKLEAAERAIAPYYDEYTAQQPAYTAFQSEEPAFQTRKDDVKTSLFQSEMIIAGLGQIDTTQSTVDAEVADLNYKAALEALRINSDELGLLEAEIIRLTEAEETARTEFEALTTRISDLTEQCTLEEVASRVADVSGETSAIEQSMAIYDYSSANSQISSANFKLYMIEAEAEVLMANYAAEQAEAERLKGEWDAMKPRHDTVRQEVSDLAEWGEATIDDLTSKIVGIDDAIAEEQWAILPDLLLETERSLQAPYQAYELQKQAQETYDAEFPKLRDRASAAEGNSYKDQTVTDELVKAQTELTDMESAAASQDYIDAITRIAPLGTKLDKIETMLSDLEVRARKAEEMGIDPASSDPKLDQAVAEENYAKERPKLDERVEAVRSGEMGGADIERSLGQLDTILATIESYEDAGDYVEALDGVRDAIPEVNIAENWVRSQQQLLDQFEDNFRDVSKKVDDWAACPFKVITEQADAISAEFDTAHDLVTKHDYQGAVNLTAKWSAMLLDLDKAHNELVTLDSEVQRLLLAAQPRVAKANSNTDDAASGNVKGITDAFAQAETYILDQNFAEAKNSLVTLGELLDIFEDEQTLRQAEQRYRDTVDLLDLDRKMANMTSEGYPEVDVENQAVSDAHDIMLKAAETQGWTEATDAAYELSSKLETYDTAVATVDCDKETYEKLSPGLMYDISAAVPAKLQDDPEIKTLVDDVETSTTEMEANATARRYSSAVTFMREAREKLGLVEDKKHELLVQIDSQQVNKFISDEAETVVGIVADGINDSADRFGDWVERQVLSSKVDRGWTKTVTGTLDFLTVVSGGAGNPVAAALFKGASILISIGVENEKRDIENR